MKVLFFFPNSANYAVVSGATTILAGIAKNECGWDVSYFDAFNYVSEDDTYSYQSTQALSQRAGGKHLFKTYGDVGHGTNMFQAEPTLMDTIIDWLKS